PALNLTSSSVLSFSHNYDFARFPLDTPDTAFQGGGRLELSADGSTWIDLGPYITAGGYTGIVDSGSLSPIHRKPPLVGPSDGGASSPVPGRTDAMTPVIVNLGAALTDPNGAFRTTVLPGARIRFRLGSTFQILIGGVQGSGWGIDDITVTGLMQPGTCSTAQPPTCAITGVTPGSGAQGQSLNVTIAGSGFAAGSVAVFSKDGSADDGIQEGSATGDGSGTHLTLPIAIDASAPEGPHDLAVHASSGALCMLRSAFVVTASGGGGSSRTISCDDPSISRQGGWNEVSDSRSQFGQYCRNIGAHKGNSGAYLELPIQSANGGTVSVVYAKGPRGGNAGVSLPPH